MKAFFIGLLGFLAMLFGLVWLTMSLTDAWHAVGLAVFLIGMLLVGATF